MSHTLVVNRTNFADHELSFSSSNGQKWVSDGDDEYVTTIFAFTCSGQMQTGFFGGYRFYFSITPDRRVIVSQTEPPARLGSRRLRARGTGDLIVVPIAPGFGGKRDSSLDLD